MLARLLMLVVLSVSAGCNSKALAERIDGTRHGGSGFKPYGFKYEAIGEDGGGHTREESSDRPGRVVGSYTIFTRDGLERRVYYEADENGFRARVETNEPGVQTSRPADVSVVHTGDDAVRTAATHTPTRTSPSPTTQNGGATASSELPPGVILPPRYRPTPRGATQISSRILKLDSSSGSQGKQQTPSKDRIATEAVARSQLLNIRPTQSAATIVPLRDIHAARRPQYVAQPRRPTPQTASSGGSDGLTLSRPNYPISGQEQKQRTDYQHSPGVYDGLPLLHSVTQQSVELPHSSGPSKVTEDTLRNSGQQGGDGTSHVREQGYSEGTQDAGGLVTGGHGDIRTLPEQHPQRLDFVPPRQDHHTTRIGAAGGGRVLQPIFQTTVRRTQGYTPPKIGSSTNDDNFKPFKPKPIEPGHPKPVFIGPTPPTSYNGYQFPRPGAVTQQEHVSSGQPAIPGQHRPSGHLPLHNGPDKGLAGGQVLPGDVRDSAVQTPYSDRPQDGHDTGITVENGRPLQSLDSQRNGTQPQHSYPGTTGSIKTEEQTPLSQPPLLGDAKYQFRTPSPVFGGGTRTHDNEWQDVDPSQGRGHDVFPLGTRKPHHASDDLAVFRRFNHGTIPQMVERYATPVPVKRTYEIVPGTPDGRTSNVLPQKGRQILGVLSYSGLQPLLVNMEVTSNQRPIQERRQPTQEEQPENLPQVEAENLRSGAGHFSQELHPKQAENTFSYPTERTSHAQNHAAYPYLQGSVPYDKEGDVSRRSLTPTSHDGSLVRVNRPNLPQSHHVHRGNTLNNENGLPGSILKTYSDGDDRHATGHNHDIGSFIVRSEGGQSFIEGIQPLPDFVPRTRNQRPVQNFKDHADNGDSAVTEPVIIPSKTDPLCDYGVYEPVRGRRPNCVLREGSNPTEGRDSHPPSPSGDDGNLHQPQNDTDDGYFFNYRNPFSGILPAVDNNTSEVVSSDEDRFRRPFVDANGGGNPLLIDSGKITPELIDQLVGTKVLEISPKKLGGSDYPQETTPSHGSRHTGYNQSPQSESEPHPGYTPDSSISEVVHTDEKTEQPAKRFSLSDVLPVSGVQTNDLNLIKAQGLPKPGAGRGAAGFLSGRAGIPLNGLNGNSGHFSSTSYNLRIPYGLRLSGLSNPELQANAPPPRAPAPAVRPVQSLRELFNRHGLRGVSVENENGGGVNTVSTLSVNHGGRNIGNHGHPGLSDTSERNIPVHIGVTGAENDRTRTSEGTFNIPGSQPAPVPFSFADRSMDRVVQQHGPADQDRGQIGAKNAHLQNLQGDHAPQAQNQLFTHDQEVLGPPVPNFQEANIGQRPQIAFTFLDTRRPNFQPGNQGHSHSDVGTNFVRQTHITRPGDAPVNVVREDHLSVSPRVHENPEAHGEVSGPLHLKIHTQQGSLPVFRPFDAPRSVPPSSGFPNAQVDEPSRFFTNTKTDSQGSRDLSEFQGEDHIGADVRPAGFHPSLPEGGPPLQAHLAGPTPVDANTAGLRNIIATPHGDIARVPGSISGTEEEGSFHQEPAVGPQEVHSLLGSGVNDDSKFTVGRPLTLNRPHHLDIGGRVQQTRLLPGRRFTPRRIPGVRPQDDGSIPLVGTAHSQGAHAASQAQQDVQLGSQQDHSGGPDVRRTFITDNQAPADFSLHTPLSVNRAADAEQLNPGARIITQTASDNGEPRSHDQHLEVSGGTGGHNGDLPHFVGPEAPGAEEGEDHDGRTSSGKAYSFEYHAVGDNGGKTSRREEADGDGRVRGFYTIEDEDGRKRVVHYVADKDGFRAEVRTNEQGTESHRPAHVNVKTENRIPHPPPSALSASAPARTVPSQTEGLLSSVTEATEAGIGIIADPVGAA